MTARTHDLAAVTALGLVVLAQPLPVVSLSTVLIALLANQIGGIVPDIDQPTAPFWRNLPVGHLVGKLVDKAMGGHRFLSHSLLGLVVFAALGQALLQFLHPLMPHTNITVVWWAFIIGIASHLLMDMFTKEGIPLLLPVPLKVGFPPVKQLRITTGKWVELFIVFPLLLALDAWLLTRHYSAVLAFLSTHLIR